LSSIHDRLQQLLDGEIDAADIADDPTLVSLADRIYGIKIAAVQPVKPRDANAVLAPTPGVTEVAPPTDMLVEVIGPAVPVTPAIPLPDLDVALDMPPVPSAKKSPLRFVFAGGLVFCVLNLIGFFSNALDSLCEVGTCRGEEQTRLNLMSPHKIGESDGWSYSLLSESMSGVGGTAGGIGIPDIVALIVLLGGLFLIIRKK
jgi:hypothetical protein